MGKDESQPDYDFIVNPGRQPTGGLLPGGKSKKQRIIITAVGGGILLIVFAIVFSIIFSGGGNDAERTLKLAQSHIEIIRLAEIGQNKAHSPEARNLATTTRLALQSSESSIVDIANRGRKLTNKELAGGHDAKIDQQLEQADQRNRFDEVFLSILREKLLAYRKDLKSAYSESASKKDKAVYDSVFAQVSALVPTADGDQSKLGVFESIFATSS